MPAHLENLAVATGLEKVNFPSNPKERRHQRLFQLPHNCTNLTCQQSNVQNLPSLASTVRELRTYRCTSWIQKRQRNQRPNFQHLLDHQKSKRVPEKTSISALLTTPKPLIVWITTNWKILQEMGITDHLTCLLRNLCAGQEATVKTGQGTMDRFQIGKGVCQGCILSPCLFNFYAESVSQSSHGRPLGAHGMQHSRPPCPSPTPRARSNSCPSSRQCHATISSSVVPFSPCLQSSQHQGLFQ